MEKKETISNQIDILIFSNDKTVPIRLKEAISKQNYKIKSVHNKQKISQAVENTPFSIVIIDLEMLEADVLELIKKIKEISKTICLIVIASRSSANSTLKIMSEGVYDYLDRPFVSEKVKSVLQRAIERQHFLQEVKQKKHYESLSIHDGLTGVYNYRYFLEVMDKEVSRAKRYNLAFSLLMLDIDDFKECNDKNGHLFGNKLLREIASSSKATIRAADTIFRYGGDEFVVLLPMDTKEQAKRVAERLQDTINRKVLAKVSIGVSNFPEDGENKQILIERADLALYQAKSAGKNRICSYAPDKSKRN